MGCSGSGLFLGLQFASRVTVGLRVSNAFYGLRSWLCRFGVRGGGCVDRLPVFAFTTPAHLRPLQLRQVRARAQARSRARSTAQARSRAEVQGQELKFKVKSCDEGPGLRRASATSGKLARFPRVADLVSAAAACDVVRSVPLGRVVSPMGTAPVSGGKVRALRLGA